MTTSEKIWARLEELSDESLDPLVPECEASGFDQGNGGVPLSESILNVKKFRYYWRYSSINGKQAQLPESTLLEFLARLTELSECTQAIAKGTNRASGFTAASSRLLSLCWQHNLKDFFFADPPIVAVKCRGLEDWVEEHCKDTLSQSIKKRLKKMRMSGRDKRWAEIAEEVIERKTLWLTAAAELHAKGVPGVDYYKVSATDVFVEKAQKAISSRASRYQFLGAVVAILAVVAMSSVCYFLYRTMDSLTRIRSYYDSASQTFIEIDYPPMQFVLLVLRMLTIGALMAGIGYFLIGVARALLHEGTALYSRRHALRFGRLYVYLKGGEIKDVDELERAFKWNDAVHTAFSDIHAEKAAKSVTHMLRDLGMEALKAATVTKEKMQGKESGK